MEFFDEFSLLTCLCCCHHFSESKFPPRYGNCSSWLHPMDTVLSLCVFFWWDLFGGIRFIAIVWLNIWKLLQSLEGSSRVVLFPNIRESPGETASWRLRMLHYHLTHLSLLLGCPERLWERIWSCWFQMFSGVYLSRADPPLKGRKPPILDAFFLCPKNLRWTTIPWSTRTTTSFLQMKWRDLFTQILRNFASFCLSYQITTPWKARYILQFIDKIIGWGEGDMENVELPREGYVSGGILAELPICRFFVGEKWQNSFPKPNPTLKTEAGQRLALGDVKVTWIGWPLAEQIGYQIFGPNILHFGICKTSCSNNMKHHMLGYSTNCWL